MSRKDVELVYELSPVQQGMLFQTVYAPGSGVYVIQLSLRLTGRLHLAAFERAWRQVVARHAILRTAFYWEDLEKPLQVVYRQVDVRLTRQSWRGLGADEQRDRLARYLEADRERGFDLAQPPLMRLALFDLGDGAHQFVWSHHHLLSDGWSQGLLLRELFTLYAALADGQDPALGEPRPYRDYIGWLQRQDLREAEVFWRRNLAGLSQPTLLADGDTRQAAAADYRSSRGRGFLLGREETAALRDMARRRRLTLNTVVQGAWGLLLARSLGAREAVFGSTVAGRPADLPGADSIIGPFINTLPVRVAVAPEHRLVPWLTGLQERQLELRRHDYVPLYQVQRWSELPAGTPLFDSFLAFENYPIDSTLGALLPGLDFSEARTNDLTDYPLALVVLPGNELSFESRYDASRLEDATVARLLERLAGLLRSLPAASGVTLGELPLLLPAERHQVLREWNDAATALASAGPGRCLHELVWARAAAAPDTLAVECEGRTLSYSELERRSRQLASHLAGLGARPDSRVGVLLERSPEMVVALLGVLEAGAAYVPLDPVHPAERLAYLAGDSGVSLLLAPGAVPEGLRGGGFAILEAESWDGVAGGSEEPARGPWPESLAYVIYTSGSTGEPKGVGVSHEVTAAHMGVAARAYGIGPRDRILQFSSFAFDAGLEQVFTALTQGATLVLRGEQAWDTADLTERLARLEVTVANFPSSYWERWTAVLPAGNGSGPEPPLRLMIAGGEAMLPEWAERWQVSRFGAVRLLNAYGPTEASVTAAFEKVTWTSASRAAVPIGRCVAGRAAYVLDEGLEPVPPGAPGELCLGGPLLARGYLGRPGPTAAAFVPDPFAATSGARLYRTGDRVRALPDGRLEFLGRVDRQVKVRGFRVEPGEIEAALERHSGVREAAVDLRGDLPGGSALVAYVAASVSATDLRSFLSDNLPAPLVPGHFVILDELPRTPGAKVDRHALSRLEVRPDGQLADGADAAALHPPRNPVEALLAGIWQSVLGIPSVGIHDDFLALGGHSLLAMQLLSRVRETFRIDLPLASLFEAPTISGQAELVEQRLRTGTGLAQPPLVPMPRQGDLPLSFAQQRLWFLEQLQPGGAAYNLPTAVRLTGDLPVPLLARIFAEIVRRHESLRTVFVAEEDGREDPAQRIAPPQDVDLPVVELAGLAEADREAEARRLAGEEAWRPFDLATGPLLRLTLLRLAAREHVLLMTMHHIVSDGWSAGVLLREIAALFEAFSAGRPSPLPELPVQYADFASWQRSWLQGEVLESQLSYWRHQLAGAPRVLDLPLDRPRPAVQSQQGVWWPVALSPELSERVRQLCRGTGMTPFMALMAGWALLLGRHAGQQEVLVGTPIAGRNRREIEGLIGYFVNTLVLRTDLAGNPIFGELLERVREASLGAYTHQDVPFERLVEELVPDRDLSRSPLFQVMLVLQNDGGPGLSLPGLTLSPVPLRGQVAKFDLTLTLQEEERFRGGLEYDTSLFDGSTVTRLWARFENLLEGAVHAPDRPLGDLPLLSVAERHQALVEWNDTRRPAGDLGRLPLAHELIAIQARRSPHALAVIAGDRRLSYGDLDAQANRLAWELVGRGVGPDVAVALFLERSAELVIGLLAILKAGGAFVPLDPGHAGERLAFTLSDSGAALVLTRRALLASLPALPGVMPLLLDEPPQVPTVNGEPVSPPGGAKSENLAYVLYTSGSTGRPKGVMVPHQGLANYLAWCLQAYPLAEGSGAPVHSSVAFDLTITSLLAPLAGGKSVRLLPESPGGEALTEAFAEAAVGGERYSLIKITPAHLELLSTQLRDVTAAGGGAACLVIGGEALTGAALSFWQAHAPRTRLINEYGPTETVVGCSVYEVPLGVPFANAVPIGRPIADTRIYLLEPGMEPTLPGSRGELF
ncbi:MAG TPA: amino acid adenylation domain-containing protein, partial [Thermoanaerobaculia bacterium]|nr:amino acid adenylation domain-containing protein [Thermoanaerobaculia bacterium]